MPATTSRRSEPIVIDLPWQSPPLRSNDRRHWRAQHQVKSEVKSAMRLVCAQAQREHGTINYPVTATIVWHVTTHHRRDAGASSPTLKVVLDAAVQVGLLVDDRHELVTEERCRINVGDRRGVSVVLEAARP